jgi:hypothetical protein
MKGKYLIKGVREPAALRTHILGMELPELDFLAMVSAVRGCWVALR